MCRHTRNALLILLSAASTAEAAPVSAAKDSESRFQVAAGLRLHATSSDGRFAVEAEARYTPATTATGGRFTFKAVNTPTVGCAPFPDPLFSDGFESP